MPISIGDGSSGRGVADALAARVAQRDRAVVVAAAPCAACARACASSRGAISTMLGSAAQVGDVEDAVVGRAVVADEAGAVHREDDVELLQADVVDDLVERALQEGRVDRADRLGALERQAGGEQDRLLLGDADVEVVLGLGLLQEVQPGAGVHRRGDARRRARSRRTSSTIASPNTGVYCAGAGLASPPAGLAARPARRWRSTSAWRRATSPCPPGRRPRPGAKPLPLTVATWTTTGRSASSASRSAWRSARTSWPSMTPM